MKSATKPLPRAAFPLMRAPISGRRTPCSWAPIGTVYFSRDVNAEVKIASLTKIMTAVVALENAPLDLTVTVDNEAATVGESSAGLLEGDTMSLETALYALMVPSGNDAGIAIAKSVGAHMSGDAATGYDTFIAAMNAKAADLGMSHSVYTNPHGLDFDAFGDEDLHSSARDVATLVSYAMQNDTFRGIVDAGSTTITVTSADGAARNVALQYHTDELDGRVRRHLRRENRNDRRCGLPLRGRRFARCGRNSDSVVLDSPSSDERFSDTVALMDWAYANIAQRSLVNSDQYVEYLGAHVPLVAKVAHNDWVDVTVDATVADPDLTANVFAAFGPVQAEGHVQRAFRRCACGRCDWQPCFHARRQPNRANGHHRCRRRCRAEFLPRHRRWLRSLDSLDSASAHGGSKNAGMLLHAGFKRSLACV